MMDGSRRPSRYPVPQRYFERWTYDVRIVFSALLVALPGAALVAVVLIWRELSWNVLGVFIAIALAATLALAVRLRNRVVYPLYTLSNLLEALREGDFSLRG